MNNLLRWLINLGLFSILFLPLFVSRSLFPPFITGKNFAFRIIDYCGDHFRSLDLADAPGAGVPAAAELA